MGIFKYLCSCNTNVIIYNFRKNSDLLCAFPSCKRCQCSSIDINQGFEIMFFPDRQRQYYKIVHSCIIVFLHIFLYLTLSHFELISVEITKRRRFAFLCSKRYRKYQYIFESIRNVLYCQMVNNIRT